MNFVIVSVRCLINIMFIACIILYIFYIFHHFPSLQINMLTCSLAHSEFEVKRLCVRWYICVRIFFHPSCSVSQYQQINVINAERFRSIATRMENDSKRFKSLWHLSNVVYYVIALEPCTYFYF